MALQEATEESYHNRDNWQYGMSETVRFKGDLIWAVLHVDLENWTANRAIKEIQKLKQQIPTGRFELRVIPPGLGEGETIDVSFEGWRPATDKELARREVLRRWHKENLEKAERKKLAELKEKYERG